MGQNSVPERVKVLAFAGYKGNERPLYFLRGNQRFAVRRIVDRWYGQEHDYFKVLADDGAVYMLKWHRTLDVWLLTEVKTKLGIH